MLSIEEFAKGATRPTSSCKLTPVEADTDGMSSAVNTRDSVPGAPVRPGGLPALVMNSARVSRPMLLANAGYRRTTVEMPYLVGLQAVHGRKIARGHHDHDRAARGVWTSRIARRQHSTVQQVLAGVRHTEPSAFLRYALHLKMRNEPACNTRWRRQIGRASHGRGQCATRGDQCVREKL